MKLCLSFPSLGLKFTNSFQQNASVIEGLTLFFLLFNDYSLVLLMSENRIFLGFVFPPHILFSFLVVYSKDKMINLDLGTPFWPEGKSLCHLSLFFFASTSVLLLVPSKSCHSNVSHQPTPSHSHGLTFGPHLPVSWIITKAFYLVFRLLDSVPPIQPSLSLPKWFP